MWLPLAHGTCAWLVPHYLHLGHPADYPTGSELHLLFTFVYEPTKPRVYRGTSPQRLSASALGSWCTNAAAGISGLVPTSTATVSMLGRTAEPIKGAAPLYASSTGLVWLRVQIFSQLSQAMFCYTCHTRNTHFNRSFSLNYQLPDNDTETRY